MFFFFFGRKECFLFDCNFFEFFLLIQLGDSNRAHHKAMEHGDVVLHRGVERMDLPPGFRFHPTDEELITHYLCKKVMDAGFDAEAIGEVDLNKCEPWDLPRKPSPGPLVPALDFCSGVFSS